MIRPTFVTAAIRALLVLFALPLSHKPQSPGLELSDFGGEPGFTAKVDGKDVKLVLSPRWTTSFMVGGSEDEKTVYADGKPLVKIALEDAEKDSLFPDSDGVLGLDALQKVCLSIDPVWERMEILPHTKIGLEGAKQFFAKLPAWGGPAKVVRIPLTKSAAGNPLLSATINGNVTPLVFSLSLYNCFIDPTVKRPAEVVGADDWSYLPNVTYPGLSPAWFGYSAPKDWDMSDQGGHGMSSLDTFASRRVIVDLADDAIYVEELSADTRLAYFLYRIVDIPFSISGDDVRVAPMPGIIEDDAVGELNGDKVIDIAGIPIAEWLSDLHNKTPGAGGRLSQRAKLFDKSYTITVIDSTGSQKTVTMDGRATP